MWPLRSRSVGSTRSESSIDSPGRTRGARSAFRTMISSRRYRFIWDTGSGDTGSWQAGILLQPAMARKFFPIDPPVEPMLAKLADDLPPAEGMPFDPKWDGFRAIVFRGANDGFIHSRDS